MVTFLVLSIQCSDFPKDLTFFVCLSVAVTFFSFHFINDVLSRIAKLHTFVYRIYTHSYAVFQSGLGHFKENIRR